MSIDRSTETPSSDGRARDEGDTADLTGDLAPVRPRDADGPTRLSDPEATQPGRRVTPLPPSPLQSRPQPITDAIWRYHLDVLVGEAAGSQVWQATDPVLGRQVGVRLLPADDERAEDLREAACLAARVSDRRLIHVLDVVDVKFEGKPHVAVVTEWIPGRPLTEVIREPLSSSDALRLCAEVAECLQESHAAGIAHGRLRPGSVLISDNGEVRVRGVGVEAVLRGCDPNADDPALSDVNAVGGLLYACVTGRWPYGDVEGVAAAPEIGGATPLPSRVSPSVRSSVDILCARSVAGCSGARENLEFTRMAPLASALRSAAGVTREPTARPASAATSVRRGRRRLIALLLAGLAIVGLAILGWQLIFRGPAPITPRTVSAPISTATVPLNTVERPIPILRVSDYDPLGNGNENSAAAPLAIDKSGSTAWLTSTYNDDTLDGKAGVGLLLDLGASRPVSAVRLSLVGRGTDLSIRTSDQASDDPVKFARFASASGVPSEIILRSPTPVSTRYVLIWLTRLPALPDGGYQGGISNVAILG